MSVAMKGKELRARRKALGLTQAQVARRVGVCRSHISDFERDKYPNNLAMGQRIAEALGVEA